MATKERRVTFSSEKNNISGENDFHKKEVLQNGGLTPILKSKWNGDLIQFECDEQSDGNKSAANQELLLSASNPNAHKKDICERSSGAETEEDHNTVKLLRRRSRQLMRQYIIHRNSLAQSTTDSENMDQSFLSDSNATTSNENVALGDANDNQLPVRGETSNGSREWENVHKPLINSEQHRDMELGVFDVDKSFSNKDAEEIDENNSWTSHSHLQILSKTSIRSSANRICIPQLDNVNRFAVFDISSSQQNWGQKFLGFNWLDRMPHCKFVVLDDNEQILFVGLTRDQSNVRKGFFDMAIMDRAGGQIMHLRRIYAVKTNTMFEIKLKKRCRLEVTTPNGFVIGNVEKTYNNDNYYILEDRGGDCAFLIKRRCVTIDCPLLWDYEFQIMLPNNMTQIGEISWSSLTAQHENFYGTEISFPQELSYSSKSLLLGACFLLNCSRRHGAYLYNCMIGGGGRKGGGGRNILWKNKAKSST